MASIIGTAAQTIGSYPASRTPESGTNRVECLCVIHSDGTAADAPTSATLGGQAMTILETESDFVGSRDVSVTLFAMNEASISAMSGNSLSVTGGTKSNQSTIQFTLSDAAQDLSNASGTVGGYGGGTYPISLARGADSYTFACIVIDLEGTSNVSASSNPTLSSSFSSTNMGVYYGGAADTLRTVDFSVSHNAARNYSALVVNIADYTATGPTITSITDPTNEADPLVAVITGNTHTIGSVELRHFGAVTVVESQDFVSAPSGDNDTEIAVEEITRGNLPPLGVVEFAVVELSDLATTTTNLIPPAGWQAVVSASADLNGPLSVWQFRTGGDPVDGDQLQWFGANTTIDATGNLSQTADESVLVQHWDSVTGTYGPVRTMTIVGGQLVLLSAVPFAAQAFTAVPFTAETV